MGTLNRVYGHSLALLTDLYQLTMAYGYWKHGLAERQSVFHLFFRQPPFGGRFAVACGLDYAIDLIRHFAFDTEDLAYLRGLTGADGEPLFEDAFLDYLAELRFRCTLDAMPEGTAAFAQEPLVRVQGPLLQAQLLETPLLNLINFQTLIATKAARVYLASEDQPVLEFGLRRAQGIDGGISATRAAFVGGCAATSNVLAGKLFDIPVKGTHAHSWVMAFDDEHEAFRSYGAALPNNSIFLVDTYDTLRGVQRAAEIGRQMQQQGHPLQGIRLDSGNLAELSRQSRAILDAAGHGGAAIVASNDLDEYAIQRLNRAGAAIDVWGVGTRLATAYDQPALGGVYKLAAIQNRAGDWEHRVKVSEQPIKTTIPGILQVRRYGQARYEMDVIYDELSGPPDGGVAITAEGEPLAIPEEAAGDELLVRVFDGGELIYDSPSVHAAQQRTLTQLRRLPDSVTRLEVPDPYPVGLDRKLHDRREALIMAVQGERE